MRTAIYGRNSSVLAVERGLQLVLSLLLPWAGYYHHAVHDALSWLTQISHARDAGTDAQSHMWDVHLIYNPPRSIDQ